MKYQAEFNNVSLGTYDNDSVKKVVGKSMINDFESLEIGQGMSFVSPGGVWRFKKIEGIETINEYTNTAEQEIIAKEPQPKFKVGDKIQMIDNEDYQIEVASVYYCDFFKTFIYCEGADEYDGTIKEEDAALVGDIDEDSVLNIYQRLLNE